MKEWHSYTIIYVNINGINDKKYLDKYLEIAKEINPTFFTKKYFFNYFN